MRIRFVRDAVAKAGNVAGQLDKGAKVEKYTAGQIVDLPEPSARHWLNRQVAEPCLDEPKAAASKKD